MHDQPDRRSKLNVLVFAASTRAQSFSRKLAALAARVARQAGASVDLADMRDCDVPLYDGDVETAEGIPAGARELQRRLLASDAFIVSSPEYNASMPGTIKNLIDWGSRFRPQPFDGRHGLLMSASPSLAGGNRGLWASRVPLEHLVVFGDGDELTVSTETDDVRFLLVSGKPIGEPIAWYGPIVMSTQEELRTAFEELERGTFIKQSE